MKIYKFYLMIIIFLINGIGSKSFAQNESLSFLAEGEKPSFEIGEKSYHNPTECAAKLADKLLGLHHLYPLAERVFLLTTQV